MSALLEAKAKVRQDQQDYQDFCISKPNIEHRVNPVHPVGILISLLAPFPFLKSAHVSERTRRRRGRVWTFSREEKEFTYWPLQGCYVEAFESVSLYY
jgi:hypothetical protein